jgi:hypothetical protein
MNAKPALACSSAVRFPTWQEAYEAALRPSDTNALFKLVEIAEAAILTRRDLLTGKPSHRTERHAVEKALRALARIKQRRLLFPPARA